MLNIKNINSDLIGHFFQIELTKTQTRNMNTQTHTQKSNSIVNMTKIDYDGYLKITRENDKSTLDTHFLMITRKYGRRLKNPQEFLSMQKEKEVKMKIFVPWKFRLHHLLFPKNNEKRKKILCKMNEHGGEVWKNLY